MRQDFNLQRELDKAFGWCWQSQLDRGDPWVTATDMERRVRSAVAEQMDSAAYGSYGADGGYRSRVRLVLAGLSSRGATLLDECRTWLLLQCRRGRLRYYHPSGPDRRTSTRMRYLPIDHPETSAERKLRTTPEEERQRQRHIVHYRRLEKPLCMTSAPKRSVSARPRSRIYLTDDRTRVTCKRCLAQLKAAGYTDTTPPPVPAPSSTLSSALPATTPRQPCTYQPVEGDPAVRVCTTHAPDLGLYGGEYCQHDRSLTAP